MGSLAIRQKNTRKNNSNNSETSQESSLPNDQMSQDNSDLDDEIPF